ncbi:SMI1/KNR4 family protein [Marivirga tractuosa]|uniref:SMI1/KNR4 family protein n=1 Tax=Marivirga tractuosa TaxID=1006 RepID=UPI0035CF3AD7
MIDTKKLIDKYSSEADFTGAVTDEEITEGERLLETKFPPSFKQYLREFGALSFESEEFYGIISGEIPANCAPCTLFATLNARKRGDISETMIKVKSSGYGPMFSIDMSDVDENGEGKVVETPLSYKSTQEKTVIANSFAEFLYNEVVSAIENMEE